MSLAHGVKFWFSEGLSRRELCDQELLLRWNTLTAALNFTYLWFLSSLRNQIWRTIARSEYSAQEGVAFNGIHIGSDNMPTRLARWCHGVNKKTGLVRGLVLRQGCTERQVWWPMLDLLVDGRITLDVEDVSLYYWALEVLFICISW